jgi:hypothetical protein
MTPTAVMESVLEPVGDSLNAAAARKLLALPANPAAAARVHELAERATEGELSPSERSEYEALVAAADVVAILQAQARLRLKTA